jgi:hypothetical protein
MLVISSKVGRLPWPGIARVFGDEQQSIGKHPFNDNFKNGIGSTGFLLPNHPRRIKSKVISKPEFFSEVGVLVFW